MLKPGLHKGAWSPEEDAIVREMVSANIGDVKWSAIAAKLPGRIGKQCRERWFNHLDPVIRRGDWTGDEDRVLYEAQRHFGNRWCEISKILPGRTENAVKNRWNSSTMKRWLKEQDLKPGTGQPMEDLGMPGGLERAVNSFNSSLQIAGVTGIDASGLLVVDNDSDDDGGGSSRIKKSRKPKVGSRGGGRAGAMVGMLSHLRPAMINTTQDSTTAQLVNILGAIKSTPSPIASDRDEGGCNESRRGRALQRIDITNVGREGSPTTRSLSDYVLLWQRWRGLRASRRGRRSALVLVNLLEISQRRRQENIIRQLVEKFQRTNTTPRNAMLYSTLPSSLTMEA